MKLSENTVQTLKNFSGINPGVVIEGGNVIKTLSVMRNVFAYATIEEELPKCAFYNLAELLSVLSLFKDPELEFDEKFVTIGTGRSKVRYFYSDPSVIASPTKDITPPPFEVVFKLDQESLAEVIKASATLGLPDIVVECSEGQMSLVARDLKNPSANSFTQEIQKVESGSEHNFVMVFRAELLQKLRAGEYQVSLSSKRISEWKMVNQESKYFVSLESSSKFGG